MNAKPLAVAAAVTVVVAAFAPAAAAFGAAGGDTLDVETLPATNVTNSSATLNGNLTGLGDASNATVWFEYWEKNDSANASTTERQTLDSPGEFSAEASGLAPNTTYVYVAHAEANNTTVEGDTVEFTTAADADDGNETETFGLEVSAFVHEMQIELKNGNLSVPLGHVVASFATANNPGNAPAFAGPPDRNETADRGPPEHAKNKSDHPGDGPPEDTKNETGGNTTDSGTDSDGNGNGSGNDNDDDGNGDNDEAKGSDG